MSLKTDTYCSQEARGVPMEALCCCGISGKEQCNDYIHILISIYRPFDEKEKQQDIFSLASTKDYLFYGCRNH
jgi:hypothetical protein